MNKNILYWIIPKHNYEDFEIAIFRDIYKPLSYSEDKYRWILQFNKHDGFDSDTKCRNCEKYNSILEVYQK